MGQEWGRNGVKWGFKRVKMDLGLTGLGSPLEASFSSPTTALIGVKTASIDVKTAGESVKTPKECIVFHSSSSMLDIMPLLSLTETLNRGKTGLKTG